MQVLGHSFVPSVVGQLRLASSAAGPLGWRVRAWHSRNDLPDHAQERGPQSMQVDPLPCYRALPLPARQKARALQVPLIDKLYVALDEAQTEPLVMLNVPPPGAKGKEPWGRGAVR